MTTVQTLPPAATDLEALRQEHDDRLTVMTLEDEAAERREAQINEELDRIRAGASLLDAAALLAERRELQQRRQDRRVSRELTEAAHRDVEAAILREKLADEVSKVEAELKERGDDVRKVLVQLVEPIRALFAATDVHKALHGRVTRFRARHREAPLLLSFEKLTGLHPSVVASLRIILTNHAARERSSMRSD
jgi:hypothetical protein